MLIFKKLKKYFENTYLLLNKHLQLGCVFSDERNIFGRKKSEHSEDITLYL